MSWLNVAANALSADSQTLAAWGEDLTNASTPGFHAVTPVLTALTAAAQPFGTMEVAGPAGGVEMSGVVRANDLATTTAQLAAAGTQGYWKAVEATQTQIQPWFQEPQTGGLQEELNAFAQAWASYQNTPASAAAAQAVVDEGQTLAQTINTLQAQLAQVAAGLEQQLQQQVNQVQNAAAQLATGNADLAIAPAQSLGAAGAADQARGALQTLAGLADVTPRLTADGGWQVDVGGTALVVGDQVATDPAWTPTTAGLPQGWQVTVSGTGAWYTATVSVSTPEGAPVALTSGSMGGTLAALDQVQQYGAQLAAISQQLASTVPTGSSVAFFQALASGGLAVSPGLSGASLSASVASTAQTAVDQAVAQWIALVGQVGQDGQTANQSGTAAQNQAQALQAAAQSVDGVNANAVSADIIQEQQAYAAAAQLVTVQQQTVQALLAAVA